MPVPSGIKSNHDTVSSETDTIGYVPTNVTNVGTCDVLSCTPTVTTIVVDSQTLENVFEVVGESVEVEENEVCPLNLTSSLGVSSDAIPMGVTLQEDPVNEIIVVPGEFNQDGFHLREGPAPVTVDVTACSKEFDALFWKQVQNLVQDSIAMHWSIKVEGNCFHLMLLSSGLNKVVQQSIVVKPDGVTTVLVHGKIIPSDHEFWQKTLQSLPNISLFVTPEVMSAVILIVYEALRKWETCTGVTDETLWVKDHPKSYIEEGFRNYRFDKTLRSSECLFLVPKKHKRCSKCNYLQNYLQVAKSRQRKRKEGTPNKYKPDSTLSTPEWKSRTDRQRKDIRNLKLMNDRLRAKVMAAVKRDGVELDTELNNELEGILENCKLTDFQKILIDSQRKCASVKKKCGMKWHPAMIRFALNLKLTSSKTYNILQQYIQLPNNRTLFDYTNASKVVEGISNELVGNVVSKIDPKNADSKKFMLSFDEIHISQNLVYSKETGAMIGYCKLNEAEKEIHELEKALSDEATIFDQTPPITKTMLCFMVRGIFSSVKEVVAAYGVNKLSTHFLHERHWNVVGKLESCGLEIIGCVCDGAAVNRSFISMHIPVTETLSKVIFDTCNIYSWPRRPYYFFSDVPHLLKTLRNCLEGRKLKLNGKDMSWQTIKNVYDITKSHELRTTFKIDAQVVHLNSYSRMKVGYATKIFSKSLANEIKSRNWPDATELVTFIEKVNDFFDMLNGCYFSEGLEKKNENLHPYTSASDPRLGKLEDFLQYLDQWKRQVNSVPRVADKTKAMYFISPQTHVGIEMTVRSFIAVIKSLLPTEGGPTGKYIMARVFNQDKLEQYFMKQRSRCGGSQNPNEAEFFRNMNAMYVCGKVSGEGRRGNTEGQSESVPCDSTPVPKRKVQRGLSFSTLLK